MTERVLVVAAHPDDEVLGCGGTIARHVGNGAEVTCLFIADGETSRTMAALPNRNFMAFKAAKILGTRRPNFLNFNDQRLDQTGFLDIIKPIEEIMDSLKPTVIYTHHAGDLNLDHRIVHQAVMTACRPLPESSVNAIYAFEVPSSTEWGIAFAPNRFVNISLSIDKKIKALLCYDPEMRAYPHPRSYTGVKALARMRGSACGFPHAEAFMTLRSIVQ